MSKDQSRLVRVTPRALEDLKNIGRFTKRTWSIAQRNHYLKSIEGRFYWLAENPLAGKHRNDICDGYYSFPEGQHVIFYLANDKTIDIIGIPHKDMDIIGYFMTRAIKGRYYSVRPKQRYRY